VAFVSPGDGRAERDVNQQGEDTSNRARRGRPGRRAGKWFCTTWRSTPAALMLGSRTTTADTRRTRTFEISSTASA